MEGRNTISKSPLSTEESTVLRWLVHDVQFSPSTSHRFMLSEEYKIGFKPRIMLCLADKLRNCVDIGLEIACLTDLSGIFWMVLRPMNVIIIPELAFRPQLRRPFSFQPYRQRKIRRRGFS